MIDLSIICSCRNDNYGENLLDRLLYFLCSVDRFKIKTEVIIVEWNPLVNYKKLYEIISEWKKLFKFKNNIRILTVSNENHNKFINKYNFSLPCKSFQEYPSKNIGIRNANGEYILQTNPDIYYPKSTIDTIENIIKQKLNNIISTYPRGARVDLQEVHNFKSINEIKQEELQDYLNYFENIDLKNNKNIKNIVYNALGDFLLFKKVDAINSGGFKEYPLAIHHHEQPFVDAFKRLNVNEISISGLLIYHFDHNRISYEKVDESKKINLPNITYEFLTNINNGPDWGLKNEQLISYII